MITYWMWKSVNKKQLDEIVTVTIITPIMLATDIFGFPFEIIGLVIYLIVKEVDNMATIGTDEKIEIYGEVSGEETKEEKVEEKKEGEE